jgi:hypothetical protein
VTFSTTPPDVWWLNWNFQYANPDIYGPLSGGHQVQEAFYTTLQKWLPDYIAEFNRNLGGDVLALPKNYRMKPDFRQLPLNPEATFLVVCDGTTKEPERHQHQTRATWKVTLSVWMAGTTDWQETQALTFAYGAAARAAISQHPGLEGFAETTLWMGERYAEKDHSSLRTIGLLMIDFNTTVGSVLDVFGGPPSPQYAATGTVTDPSLDPPIPAPIADTYNIEVINEELP